MNLERIESKIRDIEAQRQMHLDNAKACTGALQVLNQFRLEELEAQSAPDEEEKEPEEENKRDG